MHTPAEVAQSAIESSNRPCRTVPVVRRQSLTSVASHEPPKPPPPACTDLVSL
ncbi:unnamed protein product, partial [Citrullus colocynthis]